MDALANRSSPRPAACTPSPIPTPGRLRAPISDWVQNQIASAAAVTTKRIAKAFCGNELIPRLFRFLKTYEWDRLLPIELRLFGMRWAKIRRRRNVRSPAGRRLSVASAPIAREAQFQS